MKSIVGVVMVVLLVGCAARPTKSQVLFKRYVEQNRPLMHAGKIKRSEYFSGYPDYSVESDK